MGEIAVTRDQSRRDWDATRTAQVDARSEPPTARAPAIGQDLLGPPSPRCLEPCHSPFFPLARSSTHTIPICASKAHIPASPAFSFPLYSTGLDDHSAFFSYLGTMSNGTKMKLAVLTSGGDSAGMNAVVRAVVKTAIIKYAYSFRTLRFVH